MITRDTLCVETDIFPDEVGKKTFFFYIQVVIYSVWLKAIDTSPEVVKKMCLLLVLLGMFLSVDR